MKFLDYLYYNKRIIYCANGLFSPLSRLGGYHIATAIDSFIAQANSSLQAPAFTFLPFRDTKQSEITGSNKAKQIFELDIKHLQNSAALIGRLDGIAKDSGVCMEIGYAFSQGLPIGLLSTDFIWESFSEDESSGNLFFDPILMTIATYSKHFIQMPHSDKNYGSQNYNMETKMVSEFVNECLSFFNEPEVFSPKPINRTTERRTIFIDIQGGKYEWAEEEQNKVGIIASKLGCHCLLATRYEKYSKQDISREILVKNDIDNLLKCDIAIFSADDLEMDAGSAALFGICKGLDIPTILIYTSPVILKGPGGQIMRLNLMIEQAADVICFSKNDVESAIKKLYQTHKSLVI